MAVRLNKREAALHHSPCNVVRRSGSQQCCSDPARNKSIREDPRINAELASEHGLTVRQIRQIRNRN